MQSYQAVSYNIGLFLLMFLIPGLTAAGPNAGPVVVTKSDITGLTGWHISDGAFDFELNQITPDFVRAFYQARGFDSVKADTIARNCVFQSVGKNRLDKQESDTLQINLRDWTMRVNGTSRPLKMKESWDTEWKDVSQAARMAFRWATFPTEQTFHPGGDYNWGMITMGIPAGTKFDLHLKWHQADQERTLIVPDMQCAKDETDAKDD